MTAFVEPPRAAAPSIGATADDLRRLRRDAGLTVKDLAVEIGVEEADEVDTEDCGRRQCSAQCEAARRRQGKYGAEPDPVLDGVVGERSEPLGR